MPILWPPELREIREKPTHGLSNHPLYHSWRQMLRRCEDPRAKSFRYYGRRGIKVCTEWHDVTTFVAWVETNLGSRPDGMTLDRADNNGNYEPGNVRWATRTAQAANRRKRGSLELITHDTSSESQDHYNRPVETTEAS